MVFEGGIDNDVGNGIGVKHDNDVDNDGGNYVG